jgi:hypothetical protein
MNAIFLHLTALVTLASDDNFTAKAARGIDLFSRHPN